MTLFQQIKQYCMKDIEAVIKSLNYMTGKNFKVADVKYICDEDQLENGGEEGLCKAVVTLSEGTNKLVLRWSYWNDGDNIYMDKDVRDIVTQGKKKYDKMVEVKSSTAIMAADDEEEFFADESEGELFEDDATVGDDIDALADQVDDLQDSIDDVEEDDVDIELDNNIQDHYIAECEACHGIFISAMIESDQVVEKISGVCPLCEKETDQYLKWVVKAVEK